MNHQQKNTVIRIILMFILVIVSYFIYQIWINFYINLFCDTIMWWIWSWYLCMWVYSVINEVLPYVYILLNWSVLWYVYKKHISQKYIKSIYFWITIFIITIIIGVLIYNFYNFYMYDTWNVIHNYTWWL